MSASGDPRHSIVAGRMARTCGKPQARERNQLHRVYSVEVKYYRSMWLRLLDRIGNTRPDMLTGLRRTEPD